MPLARTIQRAVKRCSALAGASPAWGRELSVRPSSYRDGKKGNRLVEALGTSVHDGWVCKPTGRNPRFCVQREAAVGVGGAHSTVSIRRTTKPAEREGALVRGATRRVKGRGIGVSPATPPKLQRLQEALYTKAKQEPTYRFYLLYDKVYRADILAHAYALSKQHGGAPGVDGVTFEDIEREGLERWLAAVQEALRTQMYRPQPVRRGVVSKPGGGGGA